MSDYPRTKAKSLSEANRAIEALQATITKLTEGWNKEVTTSSLLEIKIDELTDSNKLLRTHIITLAAEIETLQATIEELRYLVTELDAHEGAEGWSKYLEDKLIKWRGNNGA